MLISCIRVQYLYIYKCLLRFDTDTKLKQWLQVAPVDSLIKSIDYMFALRLLVSLVCAGIVLVRCLIPKNTLMRQHLQAK